VADSRTEKISTSHRAIQNLYSYVETNIVIEDRSRRSRKTILINQGVREGCPLLPTLFKLYLDHVVMAWKSSRPNLPQTNSLTTSLFR
jgi:hypothetical protein